MKNWQTTVQSALTIVLTLTTALLATQLIPAKYAALLLAVSSVAKAAIGIVQTDAQPKLPEVK